MKYYVLDAFTAHLFQGNPAGVCLVENPLDDNTMQQIAFENNLAETAFLTDRGGFFDLRWFTPEVEMDLCGHATLASAHVVMNHVNPGQTAVAFHTKSGVLTVERKGETYWMDFPSRMPAPCPVPMNLEQALGAPVLETHASRDLLVLVDDEAVVRALKPDMSLLKRIAAPFAFIVTAKGDTCDFVSRFFAPNAGIDEDPVTGSSHSTLIPFWSGRLGKKEMIAAQLSRRGGVVYCTDKAGRVLIGGQVVCYLEGEILV